MSLTFSAFNANQAGSGAVSVTVTVPANAAVAIQVIINATLGQGYLAGTATDTGGNTYTSGGGSNISGGNYTDSLYCLNTGSTATSITYTPNASFTGVSIVFPAVWVWTVSGGAAVFGSQSSNSQAAPGTGTDAITSGAVTCAAGSVVMGWTRGAGSGTTSVGTGFTSNYNSFDTVAEYGAFSSNHAATWTDSVGTDTFISQALSFGISAGNSTTIAWIK